MKKTAVLIDGEYFKKVFHFANNKVWPKPADVIALAKKIAEGDDLFRVYFYDAPPFEKTAKNPLSGEVFDYSREKNPATQARKIFHEKLARSEFIALRCGNVKLQGWAICDDVIKMIERGEAVKAIEAKHIKPNFKQKGVDVRIGLDIAHLSSRKIVDRIAIVAGDTDFIPAMKYARREGALITYVDITGDRGGKKGIDPEIFAHSDCIQTIDLTKLNL